MSIVYFLALIGVLVTIHEFGHFIAAKLLDFQVTTFSIGFGRPLFRARLGDTEYRVGVIPLGGYVGILGEDESEDESEDETEDESSPRSYHEKPLWQRLTVVFAGPFANLILPVAIYFVFFAGHTELPAAVIGDILPRGAAQKAGLEAGDRIVAIDGERARYFEDIESAVQNNPGRELKLRVSRAGREFDKYIVPIHRTSRKRDGQTESHGSIGVTWAPFLPLVGVIDSTSPAGKAGLETGDLVVSVDGERIDNWSQLAAAFEDHGRRRNLAVFRGVSIAGGARLLMPRLTALVPETRVDARGRRQTYSGLAPAELFVSRVEPGSPADLAGLRPGDLLTSVDGEPVEHWMTLDQTLQSRPEHTWTIGWQRADAGKIISLSAPVKQVHQTSTDEYGNKNERLVFGAHSRQQLGRSAMATIEGRLTYATSRAVDRTFETVAVLASGLWAIVRGQAPESMGGPVAMYRAASVSGEKGWSDFLLMIALISVSVGMLNLLPIPGLDGGQVLVFGIEAVRRHPLSAIARDRLTFAGVVVVGIITVLAIRNDVTRILWP